MADKNKRTAEELVEAMEHFITTKSVVGEPIKVGDTILLPLADVSFGMGIGIELASIFCPPSIVSSTLSLSSPLILKSPSPELNVIVTSPNL